MKSSLGAAAALLTAVSAHSWLECTDYDNSEILPWMKGNSTLNPPVIVDPGMPWFAETYCKAYPRAKVKGGNWIEESSNYVWNIAAQSFNMGPAKPPDTHACPPNQRAPNQMPGAPMKTAAPGDTMKLYFGGNGHARGANTGGTVNPNPGGPGIVQVYWKGAPEQEIVDISELTPQNLLQSNGFSEEAFMYPADPNIKSPDQGLVDKGNWQTIKLPANMAPGRHMMVWIWKYAGSDAPQWSTCFDVMISGSPNGGAAPAPAAPAPAAPAAAQQAPAYQAPAAPAAQPAYKPDVNVHAAADPAPAPQAPAPTPPPPPPPTTVWENVVETVYTTVDTWTTVWEYEKRAHMRQFKP